MKLIYNTAYYVGMAWAAWYCFYAVTTTPKGAGMFPLVLALSIALAPCATLTVWKRWYTGQWAN